MLVGPTRYKVLDIASDGRVLIGHEREERVVEALMAGSPVPIDVGLRSSSSSLWISDGGTSLLITEQSTSSYEAYLLKAGATTPVHLGSGVPTAVSPDGRWALGLPVEGYPIFVPPTGPGESRMLPTRSDRLQPGRLAGCHACRRVRPEGRRAVARLRAGYQRRSAPTVYAGRCDCHRGAVVGAADRARRQACHRR